MSKMEKMMAAAIGAVSIGAAAQAATVTIIPVASYYGTSLSDLQTYNHPVSGNNTTATGYYEVDFYVTMTLSSADKTAGYYGLGNVDFNIATTGLVGRSGDYVGDASNSTVNGNAGMEDGYWGNTITPGKGQTLAQQWAYNSDSGQNAHDGLDIQVGIPTGLSATDARTTWGQSDQASSLVGYENEATNNPGSTAFFIGYQIVDVYASGTIRGTDPNPIAEGFSLYNGSLEHFYFSCIP